jgi:hypothetical protein
MAAADKIFFMLFRCRGLLVFFYCFAASCFGDDICKQCKFLALFYPSLV